MKSFFRFWRTREGILMLFLIALSLFVRVYGLEGWYYTPDDASHVAEANTDSLKNVVLNTLRHDTHPPLSYFILYYFLKIHHNDLWLRGSSLFPSLFLIVLLYFIFLFFFKKRTAFLLLLVPAFAFGFVMAGEVIRPYALLLCFLCAALLVLLYNYKKQSSRWMIWYSILLILALFTHYSAALFALGVGAGWLLKMYLDKKPLRYITQWFLAHAFFGLMAFGMYFLFIRPQWIGNGLGGVALHYWLTEGFPQHISSIFWIFDFVRFFSYFSVLDNYFLALGLFFLFCVGIFSLIRKKLFEIPLSLGVIILTNIFLTLFDAYPFFVGRHSVFVVPLFLIVIGEGFEFIVHFSCLFLHKWNKKFSKETMASFCFFLAGGFFLLFSIVTLIKTDMYRTQAPDEFILKREEYQSLQEEFFKKTNPGDNIVTDGQFMHYVFAEVGMRPEQAYFSDDLQVVPFKGRLLYFVATSTSLLIQTRDFFDVLQKASKEIDFSQKGKTWFVSLGFNTWDGVYGSLLEYLPLKYTNRDVPSDTISFREKTLADELVFRMQQSHAMGDIYIKSEYPGGAVIFSLPNTFIEKYLTGK